jgi:hypothetical protein
MARKKGLPAQEAVFGGFLSVVAVAELANSQL